MMLPFDAVVADEPNEAEIARLIDRLGSCDFRTRDAATKRLMQIGEPALDALEAVATSGEVEMRRRAGAIIVVIENKVFGPELRLTGHRGVVWSVSVSTDGKRLLTGGADNTVRLWDAYTRDSLRNFAGHTKQVNQAALSANGERTLSASTDGTVRLWDVITGKELFALEGHNRPVERVAFGPVG